MKKYPTITFRLDAKLLKAVLKASKQRGLSVSGFIKEAVNFHLANLKEMR